MAIALERSPAEELVDLLAGYGSASLLQLHAGVRIHMRLVGRQWRLVATAAFERDLLARRMERRRNTVVGMKRMQTELNTVAVVGPAGWLVRNRLISRGTNEVQILASDFTRRLMSRQGWVRSHLLNESVTVLFTVWSY